MTLARVTYSVTDGKIDGARFHSPGTGIDLPMICDTEPQLRNMARAMAAARGIQKVYLQCTARRRTCPICNGHGTVPA